MDNESKNRSCEELVRARVFAHEELPPETGVPDTHKPVRESRGSVWSCNVNRDAPDSE